MYYPQMTQIFADRRRREATSEDGCLAEGHCFIVSSEAGRSELAASGRSSGEEGKRLEVLPFRFAPVRMTVFYDGIAKAIIGTDAAGRESRSD